MKQILGAAALQIIEMCDAVSRIAEQIVAGEKPVIFMFGSGPSLPSADNAPGVPSAKDIAGLVADLLEADRSDPSFLDYQLAFEALFAVKGEGPGLKIANDIIRDAVLRALKDPASFPPGSTPEDLAGLEINPSRWWIPDAYKALALLLAHYPSALGHTVLTTNFDPLIEIAMGHTRTPWFASGLHGDGAPHFSRGVGPHVVHLHGHWWNSDTLHTETQLLNSRPLLQASLQQMIARSTLVIVGYGGWPDVLTNTLKTIDQRDVLWCLRGNADPETRTRLEPFVGTNGIFIQNVSADRLMIDILSAVLNIRPASTKSVYVERLLTHNDYPRAYDVVRDEAFDTTDQERIAPQVTRLETFERGASVPYAIHAARFLLGILDEQGANQAYAITPGSDLRLLLLEALAIYDDPEGDEYALDLGDQLAAEYVRLRLIPHSIAPAAIEAVQCALRATLAFHTFRRRAAAQPGANLDDIASETGFAGLTWSPWDETFGRTYEFPFDAWAGKAVHLALRAASNDYRSLILYATRCIEGGLDHQAWYDYNCRERCVSYISCGKSLAEYIQHRLKDERDKRACDN